MGDHVSARDQALEVIAAAVLFQLIEDPDSDYDWVREDDFPDLDEDVFGDALDKLRSIVPPAVFPESHEVQAAYRLLVPNDEDDDDDY